MGYTHYWRNTVELSAACVEELRTLLINQYQAGMIWRECDDSVPPIVTHNCVRFNGVDEAGHETFLYEQGEAFSFCKTAYKPYDAVVVAALLLIAKHHSQEGFTWSSDGAESDFDEGKALLRSLGLTHKRSKHD